MQETRDHDTAPVRVGDLVLAHNKSAFATLIRFGQFLRPSWRKWKKWNHAAIVVAVIDGNIRCVQMGRRGELAWLPEVSPNGYSIIRSCPASVDRIKAVDYALRQVGVKYSVATIFSIAVTILTPSWFRWNFRRAGNALICSALVARSWEHGGWIVPDDYDPYQVPPCLLAKWTE